jgi:hypothetical protein
LEIIGEVLYRLKMTKPTIADDLEQVAKDTSAALFRVHPVISCDRFTMTPYVGSEWIGYNSDGRGNVVSQCSALATYTMASRNREDASNPIKIVDFLSVEDIF